MGMITKLDAINHMLLMAGESMVNDLENQSGLDTEVCETVLDQVLLDFQSRGMANNKYMKKFTLTSDGKISLGQSIISAELLSLHHNTDGYKKVGIAKPESDATNANSFLWNVTDQTDVWKSNVEYHVEIIRNLAWHLMDTPVQRAVMSAAARQYQLIMQGDAHADRYLQELEVMYSVRGKNSDINDKRRTIFGSGTAKLRDIHNRRDSTSDPARFRFWRTSNG
mgnify:CR=1 FL=1